MRSMRGWLACGVLAGLVVWGSAAGRAQSTGAPQAGSNPTSNRMPAGLDTMRENGVPAAMQERMAIQRNDERQKKLQADTEQLLSLATALKAEVDKTDKYTLSLDVVKRTAEIEKLAKNIRERMKD